MFDAVSADDPDAPPSSAPPASRSPGDQLRAWIGIGTQSVGGGPATLYLIRQVLIGRKRWLTERDFFEDWTLAKLSPGVTLIALTALLGRRIGGSRGVALALGGMLIPAGLITAVLTGAIGVIENEPVVKAALLGMGPVTVGMMLGLTTMLARSAVRSGLAAVIDLALVGLAVGAGLVTSASPIVIIGAGALVGALFLGQPRPPDPPINE
jgi:chromate transporter